MIWTVLIIIISCIAGIGVVLCALVIFPTIYVGAIFSYTKSKKSIALNVWWLHPWMAKAVIDPFSHHVVITLCGYTLGKKGRKSTSTQIPDDASEKEKKQGFRDAWSL